jgi:CRP/FNR family nitrogen fixation transcriptional regulator
MQAFTARNATKFPAAVVMQGAAALRPVATPVSTHGIATTLAKGDELFAEGDDAEFFYKVVSGTIRTDKLLSDGRRQIDAFHLAGDIFGMETGAEHRFSAEAVGPAKVIAYRRCALQTLAQRDPALGNQVVASMMCSLERAQNHMLLLGRKTAQEKIATFLLDIARRTTKTDSFELPMQRSDIADHLGLTIETVSRTLSEFARKHYIDLVANSRSMTICNKVALQQLNA